MGFRAVNFATRLPCQIELYWTRENRKPPEGLMYGKLSQFCQCFLVVFTRSNDINRVRVSFDRISNFVPGFSPKLSAENILEFRILSACLLNFRVLRISKRSFHCDAVGKNLFLFTGEEDRVQNRRQMLKTFLKGGEQI